MAAPIGNQYAANARKWRQAIDRALDKQSVIDQMDALETIASKLIEAAQNGDQWAIKELGDRIDGKSAQSVIVSGDEENPLRTVTKIEIVALSRDD